MAKLILVRHGNIKLNRIARFWGSTDIALNAAGISEAEKVRDRLESQTIHAAYSSQLSRARATAKIITSERKLKVSASADINEIHFGWVEGLTYDEICQKHPELAAAMSDWSTTPRFPGGESLDDLNTRVQKFLITLEKHKPEESVLIVAHAGTLRLMICNLLEIDITKWRQLQVDHASISIMETYPQGALLSSLNDVSHLK